MRLHADELPDVVEARAVHGRLTHLFEPHDSIPVDDEYGRDVLLDPTDVPLGSKQLEPY